MQQFQALGRNHRVQLRYAGDVAARTAKAGDEVEPEGIATGFKDNRNGCGSCLGPQAPLECWLQQSPRAATEGSHHWLVTISRRHIEKADQRDCSLLRARRERPYGGRGTKKCDKFPSPHGFARAEDYIGYRQQYHILGREMLRTRRRSKLSAGQTSLRS